MQKLISYIITISFIVVSFFAEAQDVKKYWSLEDCVKYAYENNLQLLRSQNRVKMSENDLQQSKYERLPSLNGSATWNNGYGRSIDYVTNGYTNQNSSNINYGISTSVNLFSGFRRKHEIEKKEIDLQAELLDIQMARENLALTIASYYLNILYIQEELQVAKDNLLITQKQKERITQLVEAGKLPKGDLLEQQAQIARKESNIIEIENRLSLAYLDIYQVLDMPENTPFLVLKPDTKDIDNANTILLNYSKQYEAIIAQRPSMKAFNFRIKSAEKSIDIAKSNHYPSLGLSASIGSGYSNLRYNYTKDPNNIHNLIKGARMSFGDQYELNLSKSWGVSLNIPIFNKFRTRSTINNAVLQLEDIQIQKQVEYNRLYKELQQAYAKAIAAVKKYDAEKKAVVALEETFRYSQEKYQLGMLSNFDYNESLNNLNKARSSMLQAKYEFLFRTKILEFYSKESLSV